MSSCLTQFTKSFNVNAIQLIEGVGTVVNIFESVASKLYRSEHNANKFDNQEL